jgi:DNA polymerase-3 subunit beta
MKITILKENLAYGLNVVTRAASPRATLPILQNVLVKTDNGGLHLSATNLDLGITCQVPAQVDQAGATTVPAAIFSDLVKTLPEGAVSLALDEKTETLGIRSAGGTIKTNIKGITAGEFPAVEHSGNSTGIQVNGGILKEMIRQAVIAASRDFARPALTGVLVSVEGQPGSTPHIRMAAADGFRLSLASTAETRFPANIIHTAFNPRVETTPSAGSFTALVPASSLLELTRVMPDGELVEIILGKTHITFRAKGLQVVSQLLDGQFPDYEAVIPKSHTTRTLLHRETFLNACKQAAIFAREDHHIAILDITPGQDGQPGQMVVFAEAAETGKNEVTLAAEGQGEAIRMAFNVSYLREALEVIHTPRVALYTNAPASPGVIRPVAEAAGSSSTLAGDFLYVLMPMHV